MTSLDKNQTSARLEAVFGGGRAWTSGTVTTRAWETPAYHLLWTESGERESVLREIWEARKGRHAYTVVLLAPSSDPAKLRVAGPQNARPVRELPVGRVIELLEASRSLSVREAASLLAREFSRLEEAVVPGVRVKDFLTPHFLGDRLRRPINEQQLSRAIEDIAPVVGMAWRSLFQGLGYQVEQLPKRGYLLRSDALDCRSHPRALRSSSRLTDNGELTEGRAGDAPSTELTGGCWRQKDATACSSGSPWWDRRQGSTWNWTWANWNGETASTSAFSRRSRCRRTAG